MSVKGDGTNYLTHTPGSYSFPVDSGAISIGVWLYPETAPGNAYDAPISVLGTGPTDVIGLAWGHPTSTYQYAWSTYDTSVGYAPYQYSSQPSLDAWHYLVLTIDGLTTTNNVKIYIDGADDTPATNDCGIRAAVGDAFHLFFDGVSASQHAETLAEFQVWDRVLTPAEVSTLWNSGSGNPANAVQPASLKVWNRLLDNTQAEEQLQSGGGSYTESAALDNSVAHPVSYDPSVSTAIAFNVTAALSNSGVFDPNAMVVSTSIDLFQGALWLTGTGYMLSSTAIAFSSTATANVNAAVNTSIAFSSAATLTATGYIDSASSIAIDSTATLFEPNTMAASTSIAFSATVTGASIGYIAASTTIEFGVPGRILGYMAGTTSISFSDSATLSAFVAESIEILARDRSSGTATASFNNPFNRSIPNAHMKVINSGTVTARF